MVIDLGNAWGAITAVLALASALAGVWWRLQVQITEAQRRIDKKACRSELKDLEIRINQSFVQRPELHAAEERIFKAIEAIRADIRTLNNKLDQILMMNGRHDA